MPISSPSEKPTPPLREKWTGPRDKKGRAPKGWWSKKRRPRGEHLTLTEIGYLMKAAEKHGRHGERNAAIIWIGFVHALRVRELAELQLEQYDFRTGKVRINRLKKGLDSDHTIDSDEKKMIRRLVGDRRTGRVFVNERGKAFDFSTLKKMIVQAGELAVDEQGEPAFNFQVHFHMLRHACGYWLNEQGKKFRAIQEWMGHVNGRHTERYTKNASDVFDDFEFKRPK
jgi:type 1 fimbriae regulatory protein FimB/type 1 fimbriae regulatory protein FimE